MPTQLQRDILSRITVTRRINVMRLTAVLTGLAAMAMSLPAGTINFSGGGSLGENKPL